MRPSATQQRSLPPVTDNALVPGNATPQTRTEPQSLGGSNWAAPVQAPLPLPPPSPHTHHYRAHTRTPPAPLGPHLLAPLPYLRVQPLRPRLVPAAQQRRLFPLRVLQIRRLLVDAAQDLQAPRGASARAARGTQCKMGERGTCTQDLNGADAGSHVGEPPASGGSKAREGAPVPCPPPRWRRNVLPRPVLVSTRAPEQIPIDQEHPRRASLLSQPRLHPLIKQDVGAVPRHQNNPGGRPPSHGRAAASPPHPAAS